MVLAKYISGWWFQPNWKICSSNWVHLPQFSGWKWKIFELPPPRYAPFSWIFQRHKLVNFLRGARGQVSSLPTIQETCCFSIPMSRLIKIWHRLIWKICVKHILLMNNIFRNPNCFLISWMSIDFSSCPAIPLPRFHQQTSTPSESPLHINEDPFPKSSFLQLQPAIYRLPKTFHDFGADPIKQLVNSL